MINQVAAPGLFTRNYFYRYGEDALDLCDALSSFDGRGKLKLDELCRLLMLGGKPTGMDGSNVEEMVMQGRISDGAAYCETDIVNTYGVWLHYQLFRGSLTLKQFVASKEALCSYLHAQSQKKPHLLQLLN